MRSQKAHKSSLSKKENSALKYEGNRKVSLSSVNNFFVSQETYHAFDSDVGRGAVVEAERGCHCLSGCLINTQATYKVNQGTDTG